MATPIQAVQRMIHVTHPGMEPYVPQVFREHKEGVRPSVERLLNLIDTEHPSWPTVADALREMRASGVELDEAAIRIAAKVGMRRWERAGHIAATVSRGGQRTPTATADSIVYYIRRGDLIKIGTTTQPAKRFAGLLPDEILAIEPGSYPEETRRHLQFARLRTRCEYFSPAPELMEHVGRLRQLYGEPDPSWPTNARFRNPEFHDGLPPATSTATVTAAEAETQLGIKVSTLRGWVHRRKVQPVGRDERNHQIFYVDHLVLLRGGYRARSNRVA